MRTWRLLGLLSILFFTGCMKSNDTSCSYSACDNRAPDGEIATLQAYITNNSITATQHCSGLFYRIEREGTGSSVNSCSDVRVTYKGMLTNGSIFDQGTLELSLEGVIRGWRNAVPLIKAGGRIVMYLPPSLGYGASGYPPDIPGNSILVFEVDLL